MLNPLLGAFQFFFFGGMIFLKILEGDFSACFIWGIFWLISLINLLKIIFYDLSHDRKDQDEAEK